MQVGEKEVRAVKNAIRYFAEQKARKIVDACKDWVDGRVLDVGAGRCLIAKRLHEETGSPITCIDVKDLNVTDMKLIVYDGKKLPFPDGHFDTVLVVYVLHHCEEPLETLSECKRVARKRIIIFEDVGIKAITLLLDYTFNKLHGVDTPFNFKSEKEWHRAFNEQGLKIVKEAKGVEKQWFYPFVPHIMYVLEKTENDHNNPTR